MLVTIDRYRAITGDRTTPAVDFANALDDAVDRLEERLDRKLASAQRTERMFPTRDWSLWPHATPVTAVPNGWTADGDRLFRSDGFGFPVDFNSWPNTGVDVTYTGGWVERTANPSVANRLPAFIEADLAWAAYQLVRPARAAAALDVPEGATSISLGDASVSYGPKGAVATAPAEGRIKWSRRTLSYSWIRIGGEPCWP